MNSQDNDQVTHKTSSVSVGGNVGGSVVTGDHNTTTSDTPAECTKPWWVKTVEWLLCWFNKK